MNIFRGRALPGAVVAALCAVMMAGCQGNMLTHSSEGASGPGGQTTGQPPGQTTGGEEGPALVGIPRPEDDRGGLPGGDACAMVTPGEAAMHRLTRREYVRTIGALFPGVAVDSTMLGEDERVGPFAANTKNEVGTLQVEQFQSNAEAIADAVVQNLGAYVPCATTRDVTIASVEAETLQGTAGAAQGDAWGLWSNGFVETNVDTPRAGLHRLAIRAWGSQAGADLPKMRVTVDGVEVQTFEVGALRAAPEVYTVERHLDRGPHLIQVAFTNDFNQDGADRNLWVDVIDVVALNVSEGDAACAQSFIGSFGAGAWRRPLSEQEQQRFTALYEGIAAEQGFVEGVRAVVEAGLQSPWFLYRVEPGVTSTQPVVKLTGVELASRLSYYLWDGPPDAELMRAAQAGELDTREGIAQQARRMLKDARARETINHAFLELLGLADFAALDKVPAELREKMGDELLAFVDHVVWEGDGKLSTLLTSPVAFVHAETASLYGVEAPPAGEMARVELDGTRRAGLLTLPAVLARYGYGQIPVHRGLFVRETFLCDRPAPPPNELINPPDTYTGQSMRSQAQGRLDHNGCGACHVKMDPIGLAFDVFDSRGKWQQQDGWGNMLTSDGAIMRTQSTDAEISGAVELAGALAASSEVRACLNKQWLRFAVGREVTREDVCATRMIEQAMLGAEDNVLEVFVALTTTDAFRYRIAYAATPDSPQEQ